MKLSKKLKTGITLTLVIALFVLLNLTQTPKVIKNFFYLISQPIQKTLWRVGNNVSDFFKAVSEIKNLKKENEELKLRIQELLGEKVASGELQRENEFLREALGLGLEKEFKLQIVEVIGKDISQDSILINNGAIDGISEGFSVITQQKTLVGEIAKVYKNFSKVALISNKESSFDAKVYEKDLEGVVKGKGNFKLFLELLPKEEEIKEGDLVVTTSLSGIYPGGLLVGQIKEVKKSDIEPFQMAEIQPSFDIGEIESLFVITEFVRH